MVNKKDTGTLKTAVKENEDGSKTANKTSTKVLKSSIQTSVNVSKASTRPNTNVSKMATLAIFTALAFAAVCVFHIKVMFLTFDIKDAVITVAAMIFGPLSAVAMTFAVSLIELFTISDTGIYGFIMNVLSTLAFSGVASLIYKYKRSMLGAILGLLVSVLSMTAVMLAANLFITPYYMGTARAEVAALIPKLFLPFNLMKGVLNAGITLLIYKPIVTAMRRAGVVKRAGAYNYGKTGITVTVISAVIIAASLAVFFKVLGAEISWFDFS